MGTDIMVAPRLLHTSMAVLPSQLLREGKIKWDHTIENAEERKRLIINTIKKRSWKNKIKNKINDFQFVRLGEQHQYALINIYLTFEWSN